MQTTRVICSNCGGEFSGTEAKCPYCGMINEAGAERAYKDKLENIRNNLDKVDGIVVTNLREDLKRFFKVFSITFLCVMAFAAMVHITGAQAKEKERQTAVRDMNSRFREILEFREITDEWDKLYEAGKYEEMYDLISEQKKQYTRYTSWKNFYFYQDYGYLSSALEVCDSIKANNGKYGSFELSGILYGVANLDIAINEDQYFRLSFKQKEVLRDLLEKSKEEIYATLDMSSDEFEAYVSEITKGKTNLVTRTDCDAVAEKGLGD